MHVDRCVYYGVRHAAREGWYPFSNFFFPPNPVEPIELVNDHHNRHV